MKRCWSSGRISACQAGGPGPIPGQRILFFSFSFASSLYPFPYCFFLRVPQRIVYTRLRRRLSTIRRSEMLFSFVNFSVSPKHSTLNLPPPYHRIELASTVLAIPNALSVVCKDASTELHHTRVSNLTKHIEATLSHYDVHLT